MRTGPAAAERAPGRGLGTVLAARGLTLVLAMMASATWWHAKVVSAQELTYRKEYHSPKLEGVLARLQAGWNSGETGLAKRALDSGIEIDSRQRVEVVLEPRGRTLSGTISSPKLEKAGAEIAARSQHLLRVSVPVTALGGISEVPGVEFVRRPYRPQPLELTSEGVAKLGAVGLQTKGHGGSGVRIAIIDAGFEGAATARSVGELPATWVEMDFTGQGLHTGGPHGTACAEIVYDLAPDAELYLMKVASIVDLENAKDAAIQNDVDIVTMSLAWFGYGYGDGQGLTCQIVDEASQNGVLWVNSAGNYATQVYDSYVQDTDGDGFHEFAGGAEVLKLLNVGANDAIDVWLTWYDWPVTSVDCDLLLYRLGGGGAELVAKSDTNFRYDNAQEHLYYFAPSNGTYGVAAWKDPTARDVELKVVSVYHALEGQLNVAGSISIPADARGALAVGAMDYRNWQAGPVETFSSRGPTYDGRTKPEITGPDGVSTFSMGARGFYGTSAACPHVAGAAALLKSSNPRYYTAERLRDVLTRATVDLGAPGMDNIYGWGRLDLSMVPIGDPEMSLSPVALSFGEVVIGRAYPLTLSVLNTGTASLVLKGIAVQGGNGFSASPQTLLVPPDRTQSIQVTFSPTAVGTRTGSMVLQTNLAEEPTRTLSMRGNGVEVQPAPAPRIALRETAVALDTVEVGGVARHAFPVANTGNATLTVSDISSPHPQVSVAPSTLTVPAGDVRVAYVTFAPKSAGDLQTELTVTCDDPDQKSVSIAVTGSARGSLGTFSVTLRPGSAGGSEGNIAGPDSVITVRVIGASLAGAVGFAGLLEFEPKQMSFRGFDAGPSIPEAHSPGPKQITTSQVEVTAASFRGGISTSEAELGTVSLQTSAEFTGGVIRLTEARIRRNGRFEYLGEPVELRFSVAQDVAGDFSGDGHVTFTDFILFAGKYGLSHDEEGYDASYDLDSGGSIGFEDFIIFAGQYGT